MTGTNKLPSVVARMQRRKDAGQAVGWKEIEELAKLVDALMEAVLDNRKHIAAIRSKGIEFVGVWQPASEYTRGQLATYRGGVWHCNSATRDQPGTSPAWTLAVKGGDK